jgi:hypothetical protein
VEIEFRISLSQKPKVPKQIDPEQTDCRDLPLFPSKDLNETYANRGTFQSFCQSILKDATLHDWPPQSPRAFTAKPQMGPFPLLHRTIPALARR